MEETAAQRAVLQTTTASLALTACMIALTRFILQWALALALASVRVRLESHPRTVATRMISALAVQIAFIGVTAVLTFMTTAMGTSVCECSLIYNLPRAGLSQHISFELNSSHCLWIGTHPQRLGRRQLV